MSKRTTVGTVLKSKKEGEIDYIKLSGYTKDRLIEALTKTPANGGLILKLENSTSLKKKADYLLENGKISTAAAEAMRGHAEKIPDFVRFEIIFVDEAA